MFMFKFTYAGLNGIRIGDPYNDVLARLKHIGLIQEDKYQYYRNCENNTTIISQYNAYRIHCCFAHNHLFLISIGMDEYKHFDSSRDDLKKNLIDTYGSPVKFKNDVCKWYDEKNGIEYSLNDIPIGWEIEIKKKVEYSNIKRIFGLLIEKLKFVLFILIAIILGIYGLIVCLSGDYVPPY